MLCLFSFTSFMTYICLPFVTSFNVCCYLVTLLSDTALWWCVLTLPGNTAW